jgi:DUF4097 and DUF4098 domain-containing protein YvlB
LDLHVELNDMETIMKDERKRGAKPRAVTVLLTGALVLTEAAGPLGGQVVPFDETRALQPNASVEIEVVSHSLIIEGWDRSEIQITGEYDSEFESLEISGGEQSVEFRIRQEDDSDGDREGSSEIRIRLPRGARIEAGTVSGSVRAGAVSGTFEGSSVSGTVEVEGNLDSAELESVSGSVSYHGDAPSVSLQSVSGSVEYSGESGAVELESVSGSVRMEGSAEMIEASSVSGSVEISSSSPIRSLEAKSVSGRVDFSGSLASDGRIEAESHSGSVDLAIGGSVELSSFSGDVGYDLATVRDVRDEGGDAPGKSVTFLTGNGTGRVEASSFSGSVRIRSGGV